MAACGERARRLGRPMPGLRTRSADMMRSDRVRISHRVAQAVLCPALAVAAAVVLVGMVIAAHISPTAAAGGNLLANPSMEAKDATTGLPACWQGSGSGTNASAVSSSADAHSGAGALNLTMTQYSNGERRI